MSTDSRPTDSAISPNRRRAHAAACWAKSLARILLLGWASSALCTPRGPELGRPMSIDDIADLSIHVFPDGSGLPPGRGSVAEGKGVYEEKCASCHGPNGQGASAEELAGGRNALTDDPPDKTIGTYWPYATTLFDFIQRSMPLDAPRSLNADQIYAVTAYLLFLNGIVDPNRELDAASLARIEMPNRNGFIRIFQPDDR